MRNVRIFAASLVVLALALVGVFGSFHGTVPRQARAASASPSNVAVVFTGAISSGSSTTVYANPNSSTTVGTTIRIKSVVALSTATGSVNLIDSSTGLCVLAIPCVANVVTSVSSDQLNGDYGVPLAKGSSLKAYQATATAYMTVVLEND